MNLLDVCVVVARWSRPRSVVGGSGSSRACSRGRVCASASRSASRSCRASSRRSAARSADDRVTVAVLFLILVATIGQAFGLGIGLLVHRVVPAKSPLPSGTAPRARRLGVARRARRSCGWSIPSLATAKGWPARMARGSAVVARDRFSSRPNSRHASRRGAARSPTRRIRRRWARSTIRPNPGRRRRRRCRTPSTRRRAASIVKVSGSRVPPPSRKAAAGSRTPGIVVTNAHVVAGEEATTVEDIDGDRTKRRSCAFDPVRDLAVLVGAGSERPPLMHGDGRERGDIGAVYGHPGGGPLTASPARVGDEILAVGTDIYRTGVEPPARVRARAPVLKPGDSGGALVDSAAT